MPGAFTDLRARASKEHSYGRRGWGKITGICLHQTACMLGERVDRWRTLGAHIGITRRGQVIWVHDFERLVSHGNGWNTQTVGIEIDGLYAGVEGRPETVWDDPSTPGRETGQRLTQETIDAAKATIRWICSTVTKNGGSVRALVAHRQSSPNRRNDPGSAIWKAVALPMADELGLTDGGPGFKLGAGWAIPEEWDSHRTGEKY